MAVVTHCHIAVLSVCRPQTPDVDHPYHVVSLSGQSSASVHSDDSTAEKASSPSSAYQGLHKASTNPRQTAPNLFQAGSSRDLSDEDSDSSQPKAFRARASPKSPSRAHVQQPLNEVETAKDALAALAKLSMIERTHSAPGGIPFGMLIDLPGMSRTRRPWPISIPEDRPVGPTAPVDKEEAVERPIRKVLLPTR